MTPLDPEVHHDHYCTSLSLKQPIWHHGAQVLTPPTESCSAAQTHLNLHHNLHHWTESSCVQQRRQSSRITPIHCNAAPAERERAHHTTRRAAYKHTRAHFWCSSCDPCRFTILTAVCDHQEKPGNPSRWPTGQHNIWAKNRPCSQYDTNTPANASAPDSNIRQHAFPSCTLLSSFICVFS